MPELPEVETTLRGLNILKNKIVTKVHRNTKKLRYIIPNTINIKLKDQKLIRTKRIAKYILLIFENNYSLIIHLGMSGRLRVNRLNSKKNKHDHFVLFFQNNYILSFNDPRKFGFIDIAETKKINKLKYLIILGVDALSPKLTSNYMYDKIRKSEVRIKQILLNQHIIAGIGNIYASEILFDAKISPLEKGKNLNFAQISTMLNSIRKILLKAIKYGGSSVNDFKSPNGALGNFQSNFTVYGKEGEKILGFRIKKIVQYGRATYYCPKLQKKTKY